MIGAASTPELPAMGIMTRMLVSCDDSILGRRDRAP